MHLVTGERVRLPRGNAGNWGIMPRDRERVVHALHA